uniref:putative uncharacterized protein DDB_G0282133 n=1 Tax=Vespula vulgaris TaxID=7454 RepID=UPI00223BA5FE|nr:putative uncharacterized protein DDB_G0282133 [Vespula vulgaris]
MKSQGSIFHLAGYHGFHVILIVLCIMFFLPFGTSERLQDKIPDNKKNVENIQEVHGSGSKIDQSQSIKSIDHRSENVTNESDSPALRSFLKNILKARDELKWIDQAADSLNDPNRVYRKNKGIYERKESIKNQRPSNDRFSLGDRLNSNKNLQYARVNGENRWTRNYEVPRTNNDDSDYKMIYNLDKKETMDSDASLEKLKQTVLELKENLTRRDDNSERSKAIQKAILNNNEYDRLTEVDSSKKKNKDERKKDTPSFSPSKSQKHTERSNAPANEDENTSTTLLFTWLF